MLQLMLPRGQFRSRQAFSLVEVLVVVLIIGVLAALVSPAVGSAMRRTREAQCVSNLRQIGAGISLYAAENDQKIVYNIYTSSTWVQALAPYINNGDASATLVLGVRPSGVWVCPESRAVTKGGSYSHYGKNILINENVNSITYNPPRYNGRMASLVNPSKLFAVGDAGTATLCGRDLAPWTANGGFLARHGKYVNVLFFDFHVESVDPATLPTDSYQTQHSPPWSDG